MAKHARNTLTKYFQTKMEVMFAVEMTGFISLLLVCTTLSALFGM